MHSIYHACEIWSSHAWQNCFTCHKKISHVIKCMEKSSHIWQKIFTCITKFHTHIKKFTCMWNADVVNLYFFQHWFHMVPFFHTLFTPFSHDFHTHSPSSVKSQNLFPLFALNETFIKWTPLLSGRGHLKSTWNGHFYCYQRVLNGHL